VFGNRVIELIGGGPDRKIGIVGDEGVCGGVGGLGIGEVGDQGKNGKCGEEIFHGVKLWKKGTLARSRAIK